MNKYIKEQLSKVTKVQLPTYDDNTVEIIIPKIEKVKQEFEVDKFYLIKLENYLLHPSDNFTLHVNWNHNVIPKHAYYKCKCVKVMGNMIFILGVAFDIDNKTDLEEYWDGWLPKKSVTILREI